MIPKREILKRLDGAQFHEQFNFLLKEWKRHQDHGRDTDEAFALSCGVSRRAVITWKNSEGMIPDERNFTKICNVLEVDPACFLPQQLSELFYTEHAESDIYTAARESGLNPEFVDALRKIPSFGESFPLWSPLTQTFTNWDEDDEETEVTRPHSFGEAATDGDRLFQFEKDGRRVCLSVADIPFLKEMQDKMAIYALDLMKEHQRELDRQAEEATAEVQPDVSEDGKSFTDKALTPKMKRRIDKQQRFRDEFYLKHKTAEA